MLFQPSLVECSVDEADIIKVCLVDVAVVFTKLLGLWCLHLLM